ncbi:MAG: MotA/TolQ/ExbB proton channel family protein [Clostridiales bacterium]|nr:MotA/TolQ/ExbB proton channel family protein [Clostridiales bacterium]
MSIWQKITSWMGGGISVVVYLVIIVLFLIGIFRCILPVTRNTKRLKRAIYQIKQGDKARHSWQEDRFLGRGSLMPHWSEYLNNLFFADGEYHNPANVEDYINEETVIDGPGRAKLTEALPGIQVSLGFLGTLLGLSLALSEMSSVNANTITASMNTLLSSMKYAFLTSIFGVIASVSFTLLTRAAHAKAQNTLTEFYNAMAKYAGVLSVDPMTQVAIYQQEQTSLLKQLAKAMSPENIKALVEPLASFADTTAQRQQELMQGVADAYLERVNSLFEGQLKTLSDTMAATCRQQETALKRVNEALSDFASSAGAIHSIKTDMALLMDKYEQLIKHADAELVKLSETSKASVEVVNSQTDAIDALNDLTSRLKNSAAEVSKASKAFQENSQGLLSSSAQALTSSAAELRAAFESARKQLSTDMEESIAYFEGCMTQIIKRVEKASRQVDLASKHKGGGDT